MILHADTHATLLLVREHQAQLRRDALPTSPVRPEAVESRRWRRIHLRRLRFRLHPANHVS